MIKIFGNNKKKPYFCNKFYINFTFMCCSCFIELILKIIPIMGLIGLIITLIYNSKQIKLIEKTTSLESLIHLQKENFNIRNVINDATNQIDNLVNELKKIENSDLKNLEKEFFFEIYSKKEYKELRETGYHYELIGILVKKKIIDFELIYELFAFPDLLWKRSEEMKKIIRERFLCNDYWNNFEFLENKFSKQRQKK